MDEGCRKWTLGTWPPASELCWRASHTGLRKPWHAPRLEHSSRRILRDLGAEAVTSVCIVPHLMYEAFTFSVPVNIPRQSSGRIPYRSKSKDKVPNSRPHQSKSQNTYTIDVKLQAHARSTMRRITTSALSKQPQRLGTMESSFCDAKHSEKATSRQRQSQYGTNVQHCHAQLHPTIPTPRSQCAANAVPPVRQARPALEGAQRIQTVVVEELCYPATVRMASALRQAQFSPRPAFAASALHVHQPAIGCFRWRHAAAQTSSTFISDRVELMRRY